jgi:hypothetical protein
LKTIVDEDSDYFLDVRTCDRIWLREEQRASDVTSAADAEEQCIT